MKIARILACLAIGAGVMLVGQGTAGATTACYYSSGSGSASVEARITVGSSGITGTAVATKFNNAGCTGQAYLAPAGDVVVSGRLYYRKNSASTTTQCATFGPSSSSAISLGSATATYAWAYPCGHGQYYVSALASVKINGVSHGGGTTSNWVTV